MSWENPSQRSILRNFFKKFNFETAEIVVLGDALAVAQKISNLGYLQKYFSVEEYPEHFIAQQGEVGFTAKIIHSKLVVKRYIIRKSFVENPTSQ